MQAGESFERREDIAYGNPKNPMGDKELLTKFEYCMRFSRKPLSETSFSELAERILSLENVSNIKEITDHLA